MNIDFHFLADKYYNEILNTASDMLKIKSISGHEKEMADYVKKKMEYLNYDEVKIDKVGNIIGIMKGTGNGKSLMFNCHLDVVEAGNEAKWKYNPWEGKIADGKLWGRGASDTKATFAIQLYVPYILKKENLLPKGDLYVVGVVHEESSGFGSMNMVNDGVLTDFAIVGEATENDIAIASRGRIGIEIKIIGKSCHASVPELGINPFDFLEIFLSRLKKYGVAKDDIFGVSTVSPTKVESSEKGTNIIPNSIILTLDYRSVSTESNDKIMEKINKLAQSCITDKEMKVEVSMIMLDIVCYNGFKGKGIQGEPSYSIDKDNILVKTAENTLNKLFKKQVKIKPWAFATDCGHFSQKGVAVIGFSPAEIKYCHTVEDNIDLKMFKDGIAGTIALGYEVGNVKK